MSSPAAFPATGGLRGLVVDTFDTFAMLALIKGGKAHKFSPTDLLKASLSPILQYTNYLLRVSFGTDRTTSEPL